MDVLHNQTSPVVLLHKTCTPAHLEMQQPKERFIIRIISKVYHTPSDKW